MSELIDDRYELLEVLASGGMATVWRARDTRLERFVALKRPHPAPAASNLHERIAREARAIAGVSHPNLVTVFDTGHDDGGPYLVMELLDGPTLASPGREIGPPEAVTIGAQIADGLAAVHEAGIVHRDVKPSNVILSERGPCLTDFGIASIEASTSDLTQPGTILATPSYAAPEVLAGDSQTPASDVFSLAALVFELLMGEPPFRGTDRTTEIPAFRDPLLDAVIRSGLAADPGERPSAKAFAATLRASAPTQEMMATHDTMIMSAPVDPARNIAEVTVQLPTADPPATMPILPIEEESSSPPPPMAKPAAFQSSQRRPYLAAVALVVVLGVIAWMARAPAEPAADTTATTISVTVATTTPTTIPVTPVLTERDRLVAVLDGIRPPDLKPKDRTEIMEKVDEAIVLAPDDPNEAEGKIEDAAEMIEKTLGGETEDEALAALAALAEALGLDFSPGQESND